MLENLRELAAGGLSAATIVEVATDLLDNGDGQDVKHLALIVELGAGMLDAEVSDYDGCLFTNGREEYLVLDEDERDARWDECLESYLDEGCVEGADSPYFDREMWKRDARIDGAGHALSSYDGSEYDCKGGDGTWYYIYRVN